MAMVIIDGQLSFNLFTSYYQYSYQQGELTKQSKFPQLAVISFLLMNFNNP